MNSVNYNPKFSIITVSYNSAKTISETIESVISQNYDNVEYIVVDGNSTDSTIDIINKYSHKIDSIIVENDNGIYEAMNKGIRKAVGDFILLLNADDRLLTEHTVSQFINTLEHNSSADVYLGKVLLYDEKTGSGNIWNSKKVHPSSVFRGSVPHPATIYSNEAFVQNGLFNEDFKIAGDYEWLLRAVMKNKLTFENLDLITAVFFKGGISTQDEHKQLLNKEIEKAKELHFSNFEFVKYNLRYRFKKIFGI